MNIVFRVDSSTQIGLGHLMRCLALAHALQQQNHKITFICRELTGNLILSIKYPVLVLPKNRNFRSNNLYLCWLGATQNEDALQTIKVIPKDIDYLIVDSYALDKKWHKQLRLFVDKIMVIDDLVDRDLDCDILLNQNLGCKKEYYRGKVPEECRFLLGCEYALLRSEFSKFRDKALTKRENTNKIQNILISIGGSDESNLTYKILQDISDEFDITVVLSSISPNNQIIQTYGKNRNIKVIINAENMAELMLNNDLAIGAAGSTAWERCCLGLPTLLYVVGDDQKMTAYNLEKLGAAKVVNNLKDDLAEIVNNFSLWKEMTEKSQHICDGLGITRVIKLW